MYCHMRSMGGDSVPSRRIHVVSPPNSLMHVHAHQQWTDLPNLPVLEVENEFVLESEHRLRMFGQFQ